MFFAAFSMPGGMPSYFSSTPSPTEDGTLAFPGVAVWLACTPLILALAFMTGCKDTAANDLAEVAVLKAQGCSAEVGGFVAHILFMVGVFAWGWGITCLGGALGYAADLSGTIGLTAVVGTLVYMAKVKDGITGLPGFAGAPLPVAILFTLFATVLNINAVLATIDGSISIKFWLVEAVAVAIPQLLGYKIRKTGYEIAPVPKGAAVKPPPTKSPAARAAKSPKKR